VNVLDSVKNPGSDVKLFVYGLKVVWLKVGDYTLLRGKKDLSLRFVELLIRYAPTCI